MRRFLIALSIPIIIVVAFNWRIINNLLRVHFSSIGTSKTQQQPPKDQADNTIVIPSLGINAPIVSSQTDPTETSDWNIIKKDLTKGTSLAEKLSKPGEVGTTLITGHSSDWVPHKYSAVFAPLGQASNDQLISIMYQGQRHTYKITEKQVVSPYDTNFFKTRLKEYKDSNQLVLVTCWPLLTTSKRMVIVAKPIVNPYSK